MDLSYIPFGPEWAAKMKRLRKETVIQIAQSIANHQWIPLSEDNQPERDTAAIYWHTGRNGVIDGFPAIADEWRWEHHAKYASHFLPFSPPQ